MRSGTAPTVRKEEALKTYTSMMDSIENNLLLSAHDVSDGGLLIAAIESCFGSSYGMDIKLDKHGELSIEELLFSESHSRFIVSVTPKNQQAFEALFGSHAYLIGQVTESKSVKVYSGAELIMDENIDELLNCWRTGLENY